MLRLAHTGLGLRLVEYLECDGWLLAMVDSCCDLELLVCTGLVEVQVVVVVEVEDVVVVVVL